MADTSGALAITTYGGACAVVLGLAATWLQRTVNSKWKAHDAQLERDALDAVASRLAAKQLRAAPPLPQPSPLAHPHPPAPAHEAVELLVAVRIQLSRALLELDERDAALRRVRGEAEGDLRRQRDTIDQLDRELRKATATILEERGLLEALRRENETLRNQNAGATHARPDPRRPRDPTDRGPSAGRSSVYGPDRAGDRSGSPRPELPFQADRNQGK